MKKSIIVAMIAAASMSAHAKDEVTVFGTVSASEMSYDVLSDNAVGGGVALNLKSVFADRWSLVVEPSIQHMIARKQFESVTVTAEQTTFALPIGVSYDVAQDLSVFGIVGPAFGMQKMSAMGYSVENNAMGATGSIGIEATRNKFKIKMALQHIEIDGVKTTGPVIGLGYKF